MHRTGFLHADQEESATKENTTNNMRHRATYLVEFDDVGVVEQLHNLHFSVNLFQVGRVQSGLVDDFDGHLGRKLRKHTFYVYVCIIKM